MGFATGEAELRDGDYFGAVLNRAARVMAAGHGGQILLAESTAGLLSGVDLLDLGPRRLRDLPTPIEVFQVRAAGLRARVSAAAGPRCESGEPAGRDDEFHWARVGGRRGASRGEGAPVGDVDRGGRGRQDPSGKWKSRRGWPMNSRTGSGFSSWLRSPIRRRYPTRWPRCWASLNNPAGAWARVVAAALEGRVRLLVFDNCEHVLDAAGDLIEAILVALGDDQGCGHQPRRTRDRRRATVAGTLAGLGCRYRFCRSGLVRRTGAARLAAFLGGAMLARRTL